MYKNTLKCLFVALLLTAGCGTNLGGEARARNECWTLTDAEFDLLHSFAALDRDLGGSKQASLAGVGIACYGAPLFDRDSECRVCLTAIFESVY